MSESRREFSTRVEMDLKTAQGNVNVSQCGGDFIIARHPVDIPPGEAVFTLSIDGKPDRMRVYLPDGILAGEYEHRIMVIEDRDEWVTKCEAERQRLIRGVQALPTGMRT